MPIPSQLRRVLQRLLGVDVETHIRSSRVTGRVGEHDAGSEIPDNTLATRFKGFEVAFDMRPVPSGFLLIVVLITPLLHIKYEDVIRLHILKCTINFPNSTPTHLNTTRYYRQHTLSIIRYNRTSNVNLKYSLNYCYYNHDCFI
jgi:hypothetical protein